MIKALTQNGVKRHLTKNVLKARDILSIWIAIYLMAAVVIYPEPLLHRSICFGLFYMFLGHLVPGRLASSIKQSQR